MYRSPLSLKSTVTALVTVLPIAFISQAVAASLEILKVEQDASAHAKSGAAPANPSGGKTAGGPTGVDISQNRTIDVWVRNGNADSQTGTIRYWAIGRDMKTSKVSVFDGGEKPVTLNARATMMVASEPLKTEYKQRSSFVSTGGGKKGSAGTVNPAANQPEGTKMVGFAVQLIREGKVVDERYSDQSIKKLIGAMIRNSFLRTHGGRGRISIAR